jgi:hypothetical protein
VAFKNGMVFKHREAYRIVRIYHEPPEPKPEPTKAERKAPVITRSIERDFNGAYRVAARCNGWLI